MNIATTTSHSPFRSLSRDRTKLIYFYHSYVSTRNLYKYFTDFLFLRPKRNYPLYLARVFEKRKPLSGPNRRFVAKWHKYDIVCVACFRLLAVETKEDIFHDVRFMYPAQQHMPCYFKQNDLVWPATNGQHSWPRIDVTWIRVRWCLPYSCMEVDFFPLFSPPLPSRYRRLERIEYESNREVVAVVWGCLFSIQIRI